MIMDFVFDSEKNQNTIFFHLTKKKYKSTGYITLINFRLFCEITRF